MKVNATHFEDIPAFSSKESKKRRIVHVIVETPKGSPHKYELNNRFGIIAFSEVLPERMLWPFDYGFVPQTLAPDGDPLDIIVLSKNGLFSGCLIEVRVIGAIKEKKNGIKNDRLVAVPLPSAGAPAPTDTYWDIGDVPTSRLKEITSFLGEYSERAGNEIEIGGVVGAEFAMKAVKKTGKKFAKKHRP